ncbi:hypothetical protein Bpfe_029314, partial [Biomphalaria pfeifferi]
MANVLRPWALILTALTIQCSTNMRGHWSLLGVETGWSNGMDKGAAMCTEN